jgi:hypothetical protein
METQRELGLGLELNKRVRTWLSPEHRKYVYSELLNTAERGGTKPEVLAFALKEKGIKDSYGQELSANWCGGNLRRLNKKGTNKFKENEKPQETVRYKVGSKNKKGSEFNRVLKAVLNLESVTGDSKLKIIGELLGK